MRKIPCELTLGNGGDVIVMVTLDDDGVLRVPRRASYGTSEEGVLAWRVMKAEDQACVRSELWVESAGK